MDKINCRLCKSEACYMFKLLVLGKHLVKYFKCNGCGALQTEEPYWLDESYCKDAEIFDTGKASRTLECFLAFPGLLQAIGISTKDICVDFGGGTGLFARLMRDVGYSFFSYDKYNSGEFISAYRWEQPDREASLVTLFEVAEHFPNPEKDWEVVFNMDPDWVIGCTSVYQGQGADWSYLIPQSGQHLFFYTYAAISQLAQKFGRHAYRVGLYFLISRAPLTEPVISALAIWQANIKEMRRNTFDLWLNNPYQFAARDCLDVVSHYALGTIEYENSPISNQPLIAIDAVFFQSYATGIARVWKSLFQEWVETGFAAHIVILDRNRTAPRMDGLKFVDVTAHQYEDLKKDQSMLQDVCTNLGASLFISTYYTTPLTTPSVLMVHDMIPEVVGADLNTPMWVEKHIAIRQASKYLAVSKNTAKDLVRYFPEISPLDISITYNGVSFSTPSIASVDEFRQRHDITRPYFILSSPSLGYKNALLFLKAFEQFGTDRGKYAILSTGRSQFMTDELLKYIEGAQLHTILLSDEDLQCAYAGALALVYPSLYEGFGMPIIEAMACSCPVITCKTSSIPEVAGKAVIYVPTDNPATLYEALIKIQYPAIRMELIQLGLEQAKLFSWKKMAEKVAAMLKKCAAVATSTSRCH